MNLTEYLKKEIEDAHDDGLIVGPRYERIMRTIAEFEGRENVQKV